MMLDTGELANALARIGITDSRKAATRRSVFIKNDQKNKLNPRSQREIILLLPLKLIQTIQLGAMVDFHGAVRSGVAVSKNRKSYLAKLCLSQQSRQLGIAARKVVAAATSCGIVPKQALASEGKMFGARPVATPTRRSSGACAGRSNASATFFVSRIKRPSAKWAPTARTP